MIATTQAKTALITSMLTSALILSIALPVLAEEVPLLSLIAAPALIVSATILSFGIALSVEERAQDDRQR